MQLLFFGSLADIAGKTDFDMSGIKDTNQLKEKIFGEFPALSRHSFLVAVNKKVQNSNVELKEGDVVALLPPFSGG